MRFPRVLLLALIATGAFVVACGGNEDEPSTPGTGGATPATGAASPTGTPVPPAGGEELDVCTLITKDEVEDILGQTAGDPIFSSMGGAGASAGLTGGDCRFEATGVTPVVSISLLAWSDEDDAESSFSLFNAADEVDGIGDRAVSTQPVGDVSVLKGRYELSVDLYFVNEDDAADLEMASEIAVLVVSRLPDN